MANSGPGQTGATAEHGRWRRYLWDALLIVFVLLLVTCIVWGISVGFSVALVQAPFQALLVLTAIVGICAAGRFTMRPFRNGLGIDRRNVVRWSRSDWFRWR